jgi:hypothetical protein
MYLAGSKQFARSTAQDSPHPSRQMSYGAAIPKFVSRLAGKRTNFIAVR